MNQSLINVCNGKTASNGNSICLKKILSYQFPNEEKVINRLTKRKQLE